MADHRFLPNFFVVGAPKAGTTSLYHYLDQHPAIYMSPIKEPCFFAPEVVDFTPQSRARFDADASALQAYLDLRVMSGRAEEGASAIYKKYIEPSFEVKGAVP